MNNYNYYKILIISYLVFRLDSYGFLILNNIILNLQEIVGIPLILIRCTERRYSLINFQCKHNSNRFAIRLYEIHEKDNEKKIKRLATFLRKENVQLFY